MKLKLFLAAALVGGLAHTAQADDCADLLTRVDDLLEAQSNDLNEEVLGQIMSLRNRGAEECDEGNEDDATESLEQAISLFTQ